MTCYCFQMAWVSLVIFLLLILDSAMSVTMINNCLDLQAVQNNLSETYQLNGDIDCTETLEWNTGQGFVSIGNNTHPFEGKLNGQGYSIVKLFINRPMDSYVGLFGYTHQNAVITSLILFEVDILGGGTVGSLVGQSDGFITNVNSSGIVSSIADYTYVGGLVGRNDGFITNVTATNLISSIGFVVTAGGLVGDNYYGSVMNASAAGSIYGAGVVAIVGGLVGASWDGTIMDAYATGTVSATGDIVEIGGLVGSNYNLDVPLANVYATGSVLSRSNDGTVGGLVGYNSCPILNAYATGSISSIGDGAEVGGLVGFNPMRSITNAYATGSIFSNGSSTSVGGLVGSNADLIINVTMRVSILSVGDNARVGGLAGRSDGSVTNVTVTGSVSSDGNGAYVGGLVAFSNYGSITNAYASATVLSAGDNACVGGLAGWNNELIANVVSTGSVSSSGHATSVGGLLGCNDSPGVVRDLTAIGFVSSTGDECKVGGLVGHNYGSISNVMATGSVSNVGEAVRLGGLVGWNDGGILTEGTATGRVVSDGNLGGIGGLVGYNRGPITNAYSKANTISSIGNDASVGGLVGTNRGSIVLGHVLLQEVTVNGNATYVGGLAGTNNIPITDVTVVINLVSGNANSAAVGGLVGYNRASIVNASVIGTVIGGDNVGGLIGLNTGAISNVTTNTIVFGDQIVGGLVGLNDLGGHIERATANGTVFGNQTVGGLVGLNDIGGSITVAFTNNSVSGKNQVGGLVGANHGNISVVYSLSHVTGDDNIGGLIGLNSGGSVINAYVIAMVSGDRYVGGITGNVGVLVEQMSTIYVSGCIDGQAFVGALVGGSLDSNLIHAVYWDKEVTLHDQASGGSANFDLRKNKKDTHELYKKATYAGWDFDNTWAIDEGYSYPYLKTFPPTSLPVAPDKNCPQTTPYIWIFLHTILIPGGAVLTGLVIAWFLLFHWYQRLLPHKKLNQASYLLPILAKLGRLSLVKSLCEEQASNVDQGAVNLALLAAAEGGRKYVVSYLLAQYQNPSQVSDQSKTTAAQTAYARRYFDIATLLAPNEKKFHSASRLNELQNRLFFALQYHRYPWFCIWWLKREGVIANVLNSDHQTPIILAEKNKHFDEALLLAHNSDADVLMANHQGETVIDQLLEKHKVIEARQLLSANHIMDYFRAVYLYTLQQVRAGKIKEIDLSKLLLNDDDLLELAAACAAYQDIKSLNLSYNAITSSGVLYLTKIILQRQTQLQALDLCHTLISSGDISLMKSSLNSVVSINVDERFNVSLSKSSVGCVPAFAKTLFKSLDLWLTVVSLHLQRYHVLIALAFLLEMLNKLFDLLLIESLWVNKQYDLAYVSIACLLAEILLGLYGFRASQGHWFPQDWRECWRVVLLPMASPQLVHLEWGISFVNPGFARLKVANFCVEELSQTVVILIFFTRKGIKTIALVKLIVSLVTSIFFMIKMFYYAPVLQEQFARWRQRHPWLVLDNKYQRQKLEEELR